MKNKNSNNHKRIISVWTPVSISTSGLARTRKLTPVENWLSQVQDEFFFHPQDSLEMQNESIMKLYWNPSYLLWLFLRLPFRLIKGRYLLFAVSMGNPQMVITFVMSRILRKPLIMSYTYHMWSNSIPSHLIWPLSKLAASKAKLVAVSSSRVMDFCKAAGIPPEKIRITKFYTFSVDKNERKETEALRIKERLGYRKTVLFMGRLLEGKGVEYLIRAFARFSDKSIGLLIVGDGPDRNRLEKLCVELSLHNVVFAGFVYNEITRDAYYLLSDILVLPSITQNVHEEWGVVVNEAMSVGKPVIVTSSVGCAFELVRNGVNGYIVPEKNVEALYEALETLLVNDELRAQMGEASKRIVDNEFTYANEIESVKRLFQDAFGNL